MSKEGGFGDTPRPIFLPGWHARGRHSWSIPRGHEDKLSISPRLSYHNIPVAKVQRKTQSRHSLNLNERLSDDNSPAVSTEASTPKSVSDLEEEIAAAEVEVRQLEQLLLSRYRTAFCQFLGGSPNDLCDEVDPRTSGGNIVKEQFMPTKTMGRIAFSCRLTNEEPTLDKISLPKLIGDAPQPLSARHRLAQYLCPSVARHVPDRPCRISEDIIRCISTVYCKLSYPPAKYVNYLASPSSSSSALHTKGLFDAWNPRHHYDATANSTQYDPHQERTGMNNSIMIVVPRIHIDAGRLNYASKMLDTLRSLIHELRKVDPTKMEHEEQLSFWINIHNALIMHAFLAYGLSSDKQIKSTKLTSQASYDVGGCSVNAYVIQRLILGCHPRRPQSMLELFSPRKKFIAGGTGHPYALPCAEPLVHFGLSTGAYSDPPVRLYTARGIYQKLELARDEFIRANISLQKQAKILLPKVLQYYAKDASLTLPGVLSIVCRCIPAQQRGSIHQLVGRKPDKCVEWLLYKSSFRYVLHSELAAK